MEKSGCSRCIVILINVLFFIVGLTLVAIGFVVTKLDDTILNDKLQEVVDEIKSSLNSTYGATSSEGISVANIDIDEVFEFSAIFFIGAGAVLLIICVLGLVGACCRIRCMLMLYAGIIIVLMIFQVAFFVCLLWQPAVIKKQIQSPLKSIMDDYEGLNGTNTASITWNFVMKEFHCCGVDNYEDFRNSKFKLKNNHVTPWACCKNLPKSLTDADTCAGASNSAAVSTIQDKNNYDKGCVDEVYTQVVTNQKVYIMLTASAILGIQLILVIFSCKVANDKQTKNRVGPKGKPSKHTNRPSRNQVADW